MERLNEMIEEPPTTEQLVSLFTKIPLNPPECLLDEDPFEVPEPSPEVPLSSLLSSLKSPSSSPYEVHAKPRDETRLDLMAKTYQAGGFLMAVDDVYGVGTVGADVIGTVSNGSIKPGDTVFINGEHLCEVMAIEHHGLRQEYAWKDMYASILLKDMDVTKISRGDLLSSVPLNEVSPTKSLTFSRALDASDLVPLHAEQFIMDVTEASRRPGFRTWYLTVEGTIRQGFVANLATVFLNGSPLHSWTVLAPEPLPPTNYNRAGPGTRVRLTINGAQKVDPKTIRSLKGECCPQESLDHFQGTPRQFFNSLLVRQFHPMYKILTDVNYAGIEIPITYLFSQEDTPKLAVFLLDSFDNRQRYRVDKAMRACKQQGIPAMQFFMDYSNTAHYVSMRIRKTLDAPA